MSDAYAILLVRQSENLPRAEDFRLETVVMPQPGEGQLLVKMLYLSLDPYLRGKISGRHMSGAVHPGDVMAGETLGEVVDSRHPDFAPGDRVHSHAGWVSHAVVDGASARKVNLPGLPVSLGLGALGMPGLTAYAGIERMAEIKPGETFVVAAATGPVGSMAAQICRMKGARTVAIAGSDEKCAWAKEHAKFDETINYKTEDIRAGLKRTCPDGVDVYFDLVGGDVLNAASEQLTVGARVILCGLMAQYNSKEPLPGPTPGLYIKARATVRGLVVYDHEDLRAQMERVCGDWIRSGDIAFKEDISDGLQAAPEAFARLMQGRNFGKALVKVAA